MLLFAERLLRLEMRFWRQANFLAIFCFRKLSQPVIDCQGIKADIDSHYFLCHTLSHQHRCWQRAIHRCHYSGQSYLIIRSIAFAWITDKLE